MSSRAEAAKTQPPEPPVGTILETEDNINKYRIERTDLGWHIQHNGGADEFGNRLTSFGGRGISWRAAWSAWGPPSGAAPFREVPAGTPPLPPDPEEPDPRDGMGIDAADGKFDAPPAARPWTGKRGTSSSASGAGATTTMGGSGMSAVSEAKDLLARASEKTEFAAGANQQIISSLEEAQQTVLAAVEESSQAASDEAQALIQRALEVANEMTQLIGAIPQALESIQL